MSTQILNRVMIVSILTTTIAAKASGATTVLNPGPGTDYLNYWCGGQQVNEIATGFDDEANAVTLVKVSTTCHGSGRGSPNQYHLACWTVTFAQDGSIVSRELLANNFWTQGHTAIPCPVSVDPAAVYVHTDGAGNFPATLDTETVGTTSRAVLETTCAPIHYGQTVTGTISQPGAGACYSFRGSSGDGARVSISEIPGGFLGDYEMRRPDGSVLCGAGFGNMDCNLDESGLHTIVIKDFGDAATGDYGLSLICLTPSCGAEPPQPHLTIDMNGSVTRGRITRMITYTVTVGNDGDAPADDVVVEDTLPQGLLVRGLSSTQGACTHDGRAVTCTVGTIAPTESAVIKMYALTTLSEEQVTNTACVAADNCATVTSNLP